MSGASRQLVDFFLGQFKLRHKSGSEDRSMDRPLEFIQTRGFDSEFAPRTENRGADAHQRSPFLDRRLEIVAHSHR
jgi:hypothetical protein